MVKRAEIICEYQPYIDRPPVPKDALYGQASSNDDATVGMWRDTWLKQARENHAKMGPFKSRSIGKLHGRFRNLPALVLGSGPSLKGNAAVLLNNPGMPIVSCLHNFHFLEDAGVKVDYYVSLDAGRVTVEEVSEGGDGKDYWALTKGKTLLAHIATHPDLIEKWQGELLFFNCPIPDIELVAEMDAIEKFNVFVSTGGNVLGASTYIAKAILGCNPIALLGADFSFSYNEKFHGWDSKYDANLGDYLRVTDVYGHSVKTWRSYHNFKGWFDWVSMTIPGRWVNCTEGGTWGAYPGGNLRTVEQKDLKDFLQEYSLCEEMREQCENPDTDTKKILF